MPETILRGFGLHLATGQQWLLASRLITRAAWRVQIQIHNWAGAANSLYVGFSRDANSLLLSVSDRLFAEHPSLGPSRLVSLTQLLARCPNGVRGIADISDGAQSGAGMISFCSTNQLSLLVPDCDFLASRGYRKMRTKARTALSFEQREDKVLWRGATTGRGGQISLSAMDEKDTTLIPRTRMCLIVRNVPGCDVKFSHVVQSRDPALESDQLRAAGILGDRIAPENWLGVRYHIAIDGNTLAWSSLFTRLLAGCCVLKPDNPQGYRQWYSDMLVPWRHYVPVASDLSDLLDKITWCRTHLAETAKIAACGQALALSIDYEREVTSAVARIVQAHTQSQLVPESALWSCVMAPLAEDTG